MNSVILLLQIALAHCLPVGDVGGTFLELPLRRRAIRADHNLARRATNNYRLQLDNTGTYYETELSVGTPPQSVKMLLDTGSSDTWFDSSDTSTNNFDYLKSSTFKKNDSNPSFSIGYGDQSGASGFWATDRLTLSGFSLDASFGVATEASAVSPVLGLGLRRGEISVTTVDEENNLSPTYANFPELLKSNGLVDTVAYSLYLSCESRESDAGSVLFGALDHSLYEGESLTLLPIVNDHSVSVSKTPTTLSVFLDSIELPSNEQRETVHVETPVLIDSGSTLCQLPVSAVTAMGRMLNGTYSDELELYLVDCQTQGSIAFNFSGFSVAVSTQDLVVPASLIAPSWNTQECALGIFQSDTSKHILGEAFLKNVYTVFDLESLEVGMAPVIKGCNSEERLTRAPEIEPIRGKIPRATSAALYV